MHVTFSIILFAILSFAHGNYTNTEVVGTIYADSHVIRYDVEVTLELSNGVSGPYHYLVEPDMYDHLSLIEAKVSFNFGCFFYFLD